ncbi:MAG: MerR family DNA-binding transcriptional regulator [Pseudomonadota bacterium]
MTTQTEQDYFTITELTQEFDVSTRTLRFYEAEGLLRPVRRGTQRLFRPGDRTRLKLILRGKRLGFSLSEIKELFDLFKAPEGERRQMLALLDAIVERKADLAQKRRDLEETLADLKDAEASVQQRLKEMDRGS